MATVWERISPPVTGDAVRTEFTPSTPGTHYTLVDEGLSSPDDDDFVFTNVGDKREAYYIPTGLTGTGSIHSMRFGFRYKGEAVPVNPGLDITLLVGGEVWGSVANVSMNTNGAWRNAQVLFNFRPGRTVDDWNDAATRVIRMESAPSGSGYIAPSEYTPEVSS
jgi:hypothetical protein